MSRIPAVAFVLAGGEGARLRPLTANQAKPALHFAVGHRIVDFVLANLVNSRISPIYVLAQYQPQSLIEHVDLAWRDARIRRRSSVEVIVPESLQPAGAFRGTADAVHRCLGLLDRHEPDLVAVFAADHVYRMDVRQMIARHCALSADVTVAGIPVPLSQAPSFGIMATDPDGRILRFQEKPGLPEPIPGAPDRALASMGNYLFGSEVLRSLLQEATQRGGADFGRDVLPSLPDSGLRAFAYDFAGATVPGTKPWEEPAYWRDVGTLQALAQARRDVEGPMPRFDLRNRDWPIRPDLLEQEGARQAA